AASFRGCSEPYRRRRTQEAQEVDANFLRLLCFLCSSPSSGSNPRQPTSTDGQQLGVLPFPLADIVVGLIETHLGSNDRQLLVDHFVIRGELALSFSAPPCQRPLLANYA